MSHLLPKQRVQPPRIAPVAPEHAHPEQKRILDAMPPAQTRINSVRTITQHPQLADRWLPFAAYLYADSSLPARDRELVILRTGALTQSRYEVAQHLDLARLAGLSGEEIEHALHGAAPSEWSVFDAALLQSVEELHAKSVISDRTWEILSNRYDDRQLMDLLVTVGHYTMLAWYLNSLGTPVEEG